MELTIIIIAIVSVALVYYSFGTLNPKKIVDTFDSRNPYDNTKAPIYAANRLTVLYDKDWEWTKFIYKNLDKLYQVEPPKTWGFSRFDLHPQYFKIKGYDNYIINFDYTWMWHITEGRTAEGTRNNFSLGGQSNKADYLCSQQLRVGIQIQRWYINYLRNQGYDVFLDDSADEVIQPMKIISI